MLYCHHEKDGFEDFFKLLDDFKRRDKSTDGDWFTQMTSVENQPHFEKVVGK
jgi:hypothetical protein